jgi:lysophospholipase L1-like esterase
MKRSVIYLLLLMLFSFNMNSQYKYLALGDSYTEGTSVETDKSWPFLLHDYLADQGYTFVKPKVLAEDGWRTEHLLEAIDNADIQQESFDLVSLLIGVNNQYDEKPIDQFTEEFESILQKAISFNKYGNQTTFVVGIPDYSVTPYAEKNDKTDADVEIKKYNLIIQRICKKYDVVFYSLFELSQKMEGQNSMFVEDGLHPSGDQYHKWVISFRENVFKMLSNVL